MGQLTGYASAARIAESVRISLSVVCQLKTCPFICGAVVAALFLAVEIIQRFTTKHPPLW